MAPGWGFLLSIGQSLASLGPYQRLPPEACAWHYLGGSPLHTLTLHPIQQLDATAAALAPEVAATSFATSFAQLTELPLGQRRQVSAVFEGIEITGRGKGN